MDRFSHQFPHKITVRSNLQALKLNVKRTVPRFLAFDTDNPIDSILFGRIAKSISKSVPRLKNPPMKQILKQPSLVKNTKALIIKPESALAYIKRISRIFTRLEEFHILNQEDSFAPMKFTGKVHPIRALRVFGHDHEMCQDFMACARYTTSLKVHKSSLNLLELKRFNRLETLHVIFKTKYISLKEDDQRFIQQLARTINTKLPRVSRMVIEHEIDPDNHPYVPLQLCSALDARVQVDLIVDLVDVSSYKNPTNNVERIFEEINRAGIQRVSIKYAGISNFMKRHGRWFGMPIYYKKEHFIRLLKAIQAANLTLGQIEPTIHSSHFNFELKNQVLELIKTGSRVNIPKLTLMYNLDTITEDTLKLLLELYNSNIPSYELMVISTGDLSNEECDMLENHYVQILQKIQRYNVNFSLSITARNYKNLIALIQMIIPRANLSLLNSLSIRVLSPMSKANLKTFVKTISRPLVYNSINKLEIGIPQEGESTTQDLYEFMDYLVRKGPKKLQKLRLLHQGVERYEGVIEAAFERLRRERCWIDLKCSVDKEKGALFE